MSVLTHKIPAFIYRGTNITILILFTAVFALVFINVYHPFNSNNWYGGLHGFQYFLYSNLLILTGVMVVAISRYIMFFYTKKRTISYWEYSIWILSEVLFMSLFYTLISYTFEEETRRYWEILIPSIKNTFLILLIPYFISHLFFALQEKNIKLNAFKENAALEPNKNTDIITFFDEKAEMKLSVKKESLLYIESADNYVSIWYLGKMGVTSYMLRNSLKTMEEQFEGTNIIRCHRSFMVNCDQVKIAKKSKRGITLDLDIPKVPEIPVSKNYAESITKWLMSSV